MRKHINKVPLDKKKIRIIVIAVLIAVVVLACAIYLLLPFFRKFADPAYLVQVEEWIASFGIGGWFITLGIHILQTVIPIIPSEPFEIMAGVLYGTWGGMLLCIAGSIIGSAMAFALVRKYRMPLLNKLFGKDIIESYSFLKDDKKVEGVTFLLFLLPGMPKDALTYIAGVSKIKMSRFLAISTVARIPSIITGTMTGGAIFDNWKLALVIFGITILIGIAGIVYKDKLVEFSRKLGGKSKE